MSPSRPLLLAATPAVFVVLWATGFVGAKFGLPHAEPFTFLVWRFWCVAAIFLAVVLVSRAPWPRSVPQALHNVFVGVLLHGVYLGGVFAAIAQGMPAGLSAIIVGLQPALTALVARLFLNETVSARQWAGIGLGFAGLVFWGEYKAIGGLLWALAILRIFLFIREKQRYASMPGPNSSEILDAPERPE